MLKATWPVRALMEITAPCRLHHRCQTETCTEWVWASENLVWDLRVTIYASTPSNSGGKGDFGCLLSKCCLKVFGSGIWDCRKEQYTHFKKMADFSVNKRFHTDLNGRGIYKEKQKIKTFSPFLSQFMASWLSLRRHTHPAHKAGEHEGCLGCCLLIMTFGLL